MFSKTDFQGTYGKSSKIMSFLSLSFLALASRLEVKGLTQTPEEKERMADTSEVERRFRLPVSRHFAGADVKREASCNGKCGASVRL